jgi:(6-4)DNA photolyase
VPPRIVEDEIDKQVRRDLDRWEREDGIEFVGRDGPRLFPVTRAEAVARLRHLYWYFEPGYRASNELRARHELPAWFATLDADAVEARCLSDVLAGVRDRGWVHHIPRLMVLGNYAMQRGWRPGAMADWFHRCFVDGYEWVMTANVIGMSQYADAGRMSTKPYAAGGAYINRMSDYCGGCRYDPKQRVGDHACPYTAGYWSFLARNETEFSGNHRMRQPMQGLHRLTDLDALVDQEKARGSRAP